jgi:3-oxoacyl-[acyl-carrier protein] reductase
MKTEPKNPLMKFADCIVLVPGASRPVGRAIARKFADNGARLILPLFNDWPESTAELLEEFKSSSGDALIVTCDLRNREQVSSLIAEIERHHGIIDVLINNIERGGMPIVHGSYELERNRDQWRTEIDTTLSAKWNLFTAALPLLKKSAAGAVINITSIAGRIGRSGPASVLFSDGYSAANRGVSSFTETWAREAAPAIRVNEVMLGLIQGRHAEGTRGWAALSAGNQEELLGQTLLGRSGSPEEVAEIVYFLSVEAPYVTGATVLVDGGFCLGNSPTAPLPPGILG